MALSTLVMSAITQCAVPSFYWGYWDCIGTIGTVLGLLGLYWDCIGTIGTVLDCIGLYWDCIGTELGQHCAVIETIVITREASGLYCNISNIN